MLNKPKDYVVSRDGQDAKTVFDLVPSGLSYVGRLDKNSTGLLLFTNDGDLNFRLTHPKYKIEKTYIAQLDKDISVEHFENLKSGIVLGDGKTLPAKGKILKNKKVEIIIKEGRKRQIRRMFNSLGYEVLDLNRIKFGNIELHNLDIGKRRDLSLKEIKELESAVGIQK